MAERRALSYCGGGLDRAVRQRRDPGWLGEQLASPDRRLIPLWNDRCLLRDREVVSLRDPGVPELRDADTEPVFLGLDGDAPVFAVDLSALTEPDALATAAADSAVDLRQLVGGLAGAEAAILGYARGLCHWHRSQRYCGACGAPTRPGDGGHLRQCTSCPRQHFPRIEPAVIALVEAPGDEARCLLARHAGAGPDSYALLAGFVEVGEDLEDAVQREVAEEAGVILDQVTYRASQAWPFPAGLMVGFHARATSDTTRVDGVELIEARWFTRAEIRERRRARGHLGKPDSVDRLLLESWLDLTD
jgi:NAD+ diphosphatase